jgi:enolase
MAMAADVSSQLDELQRKYRIMEGDRKSYAEEVQNVVRKQKSQIEKLKRENSQLKSELSLESRAAAVGDSGAVSTKLTALQDAQELAARAIEAEKRRAEEMGTRLRMAREQMLLEKKEMGGANGQAEQHHAIQKQVKVLEHRLHRSLIKFNESISANKELRDTIDNLRRERVVFDGIYKKMQARPHPTISRLGSAMAQPERRRVLAPHTVRVLVHA